MYSFEGGFFDAEFKKFIYIAVCIGIWLFFIAVCYLLVHMNHNLLIHSIAHWEFG